MKSSCRYCLVILCFLLPLLSGNQVAHAQTQKRIDSLQYELSRVSSKPAIQKKKAHILLELSNQYGKAELKKALFYAEEALKDARSRRDGAMQADALLRIGTLAGSQAEWDKAKECFNETIRIAKANSLPVQEAGALNNIAVIYQKLGKYRESLEMHQKAFEIRRKNNDERGMAASYINMGVINRQLGYYEVAIKYYELARPIIEARGEKLALGNILNNLANAYYEMKDYGKSVEYYKAALVKFEDVHNLDALARGYSNLGGVLAEMGDTASSNAALLKGFEYSKRLNTPPALSQAYRGMGRVFENRNNPDSAVYYYRLSYIEGKRIGDVHLTLNALQAIAALKLDRKHPLEALAYCDTILAYIDRNDGWMFQKDVYQTRIKALVQLGRHKEAYTRYLELSALKDTMYQKEQEKRLDELGDKYKVQLTEHENRVLRKQAELDRAELARKSSELMLVEKERRMRELRLENRSRALQLQRENAVRDAQTIEILEKDRDLRNVQLEKERWLSSVWFTVVLALALIAFLLVVLYRTRRRSIIDYKNKNAELLSATNEILIQQEELRIQNEKLEALNHEKNEILAVAAHDLKNPIGSVLGLTQLIVNPSTPESARQECLIQIEHSSQKMLKLVSNLLDIDKIDAGITEIQKRPVDLPEVLAECIALNRPHAEEKGIRLVLELRNSAARVLADRAVLVQIVDNLVSNAIKFSSPGSTVTVAAGAADPGTTIEIADQGPGLSERDKAKLFTKFARLSARPTGNEVSTGLGLYIVKRLVDALDGRIECISEPGQGARFIVVLMSIDNLQGVSQINMDPSARTN